MHENQKAILQNIEDNIKAVSSPAARLDNALHLPVGLLIIPIFAFVNAGIAINFSQIGETFHSPVTLGILFGLVAGKILGIFGVAFVAIKAGIAKLPQNSSMSQIFGVSALGGIGFTMSIFVADLAFTNNEAFIFEAKIGILSASLLAGIFGFIWLRFIAKPAHD
jgi:NhaA family Na+:H+ antiporter